MRPILPLFLRKLAFEAGLLEQDGLVWGGDQVLSAALEVFVVVAASEGPAAVAVGGAVVVVVAAGVVDVPAAAAAAAAATVAVAVAVVLAAFAADILLRPGVGIAVACRSHPPGSRLELLAWGPVEE